MVSMTITVMVKHFSYLPEMSESGKRAIDVAVAVYKQPSQFSVPRIGNYPSCMLDIVKTAAGDEETINLISKDLNMPREAVIEICKFYLRKLLTAGDNDPFRMLALDRGATADNIKDHKRWLLKWLHPDRNSSKWESALFLMIGNAALQLEESKSEKEISTLPAARTNRRRSSQTTLWKHSRRRKRKFSTLKLLKPFILAVGIGLVAVYVVTSALSSWSFVRQFTQ